MTDLDAFDLAILRILQADNRTPQKDIGTRVNLSAPSVQRRIKRMESAGVIAANVAVVDPKAVQRALTIFVEVELVSETAGDIDVIKKAFHDSPEVQQCYYVTGEVDFMLVVVVDSMASYEDFTRREFFANGNIRKFKTFVSMDSIKVGPAIDF